MEKLGLQNSLGKIALNHQIIENLQKNTGGIDGFIDLLQKN